MEFLIFALQLCIQDAMNFLGAFFIVNVSTVATIIRELVGILGINADIVHIVTDFAKLHDGRTV
jgi:hypothetical protein